MGKKMINDFVCKTDTLKILLKQVSVGAKIYVDNCTQPYIVIARNTDFVIAIKRNYSTRHLAFDINNNKCGFCLNLKQTVDFNEPIEINNMLTNLTMGKLNIMEVTMKQTVTTIKKITEGGITFYGTNHVFRSNHSK